MADFSSLFPVLTHTHIWISLTHATLAPPFPLEPYTWLHPIRTNFGSFAARATLSKAKTVEICSVMALDAGNDTQIALNTISQSPLYIASQIFGNGFVGQRCT